MHAQTTHRTTWGLLIAVIKLQVMNNRSVYSWDLVCLQETHVAATEQLARIPLQLVSIDTGARSPDL